MEQLHQQGKRNQADKYDGGGVGVDPSLHIGCHEGEVFCALYEQEVDDGCGTDASENPDFPFQMTFVVE